MNGRPRRHLREIVETGSGLVEIGGLAEKYSNSELFRVDLGDEGSFVVKRTGQGGDWLSRVSGGDGKLQYLWESGLLDEAGSAVDHTILDCYTDEEGRCVSVMRDASRDLLPAGERVEFAAARRLLAGLAALHDLPVETVGEQLCPIGARYRMFSPAFLYGDTGPGQHPARRVILEGWDLFFEAVAGPAADIVRAIHDDADRLGRALARSDPSLLHGDAKLDNLGLGPERAVFVDWGDLTGTGPREIDVAWFALMGSARLGVLPDQVFAAYEEVSGRPLNQAALDLACAGSLAQMGFRMAFSMAHGVPEAADVAEERLDWWTDRVRAGADRLPY